MLLRDRPAPGVCRSPPGSLSLAPLVLAYWPLSLPVALRQLEGLAARPVRPGPRRRRLDALDDLRAAHAGDRRPARGGRRGRVLRPWQLALVAAFLLVNPVFYSFYANTPQHPRFLYASLPELFVLVGGRPRRARSLVPRRPAGRSRAAPVRTARVARSAGASSSPRAACPASVSGTPAGKADTGLYGLYGSRIAHGHAAVPLRLLDGVPAGRDPGARAPRAAGEPLRRLVQGRSRSLCGLAALAALAVALADTTRSRQTAAVLGRRRAPRRLSARSRSTASTSGPPPSPPGRVALAVADTRARASALLGAATAAKLYPVLLAPALLAYVAQRHGRRARATGSLLAGAAVLAAAFLPVRRPGARAGCASACRSRRRADCSSRASAARSSGVAHRLGAGYHVRRPRRRRSRSTSRARTAAVVATRARRSSPRSPWPLAWWLARPRRDRPRPDAPRDRRDRRRRSSPSRRCSRPSTCSSCAARTARRLRRGGGPAPARARADADLGAVPGAVPRARRASAPRSGRRSPGTSCSSRSTRPAAGLRASRTTSSAYSADDAADRVPAPTR